MPVQVDPQETEVAALFDFAGDFAGKRVLEIGCGDGRLTWHYAGKAAYVVAIDPDPDEIAVALKDLPPDLRGRVEFQVSTIQEFEPAAAYAPDGPPARMKAHAACHSERSEESRCRENETLRSAQGDKTAKAFIAEASLFDLALLSWSL